MRTPGKYRNVQRMPRRPNKSFEHSESRYSIFLEDPMQAPKLEFSEGRGSCIWDQQGGRGGGGASHVPGSATAISIDPK